MENDQPGYGMNAAIKKAARDCGPAALDTTHNGSNHSPIDRLLPLLDRVKRTGPNTWIASCPTREDRHPSMTIRELDDGRILLHDFGGDSTGEILAAVNLTFSDLFPDRPLDQRGKPERRPFPAADCLRAVAFEATIVALAGAAIIAGEPFNQFDKDRLLIAVGRINDALSAAGVAHG